MTFARVFFDTEFMEDGEVIEPLSLGFVTEQGKRLYVVITDTDRGHANEFVEEHVLPYLDVEPENCTTIRASRYQAGAEIKAWLEANTKGRLEFWANYCSYDWIVLCQLFGRMVDLPVGWPMYCNDLQQLLRSRGYYRKSDLPELESVKQLHNALDDAEGVRERYLWLQSL